MRALRRHQAQSHMRRRLKEDRNQHYDDLKCACWTDPRVMARFKEQPQMCSFHCCGNQRRWGKGQGKLTMQERRQTDLPDFQTVLRQIGERVLCRDRGIPVSELDSELERLGAMALPVAVPTNAELDAST